jgi:NhaP-type Na+/H+ or K+/H+ antiporter
VTEDVLLTLILFYGGLNLSVEVLQRVWVGLGLLVLPGVVVTALVTGLIAFLVFDLSFTAAVLLGAVLAPTDPAILIPLFIRSRRAGRARRAWSPPRWWECWAGSACRTSRSTRAWWRSP